MGKNIIKTEFQQISSRNKKLSLFLEDGIYHIIGDLEFTAQYNDIEIKDSYKVDICLENYPLQNPSIKEIGNKIERNKDNHVNEEYGTLCLGSNLSVFRKFKKGLTIYIKEAVIPFLYATSYKEKYGNYPWGELKHGEDGTFDYYKDLLWLDDYEMIYLINNFHILDKKSLLYIDDMNFKNKTYCKTILLLLKSNCQEYIIFKQDMIKLSKFLNQKIKLINF